MTNISTLWQSITQLLQDLPGKLGDRNATFVTEGTFNQATSLTTEIRSQLSTLQELLQSQAVSTELQQTIQRCLTSIQTYESDTFSASSEALTAQEAQAILAQLMSDRFFNAQGMPMDVNGWMLADCLDGIRNHLEPELEEFSVPIPSDPDYDSPQHVFE